MVGSLLLSLLSWQLSLLVVQPAKKSGKRKAVAEAEVEQELHQQRPRQSLVRLVEQ